jgi:drug/metabolite transporter (DMT)-like permease
MSGKSVTKAYALALLAVLFWSTSPTAFKLGLRYQDTYQLLTVATLTSVVVLSSILLFGQKYRLLKEFGWKDIGFSALMGMLNPVAYYLILFWAYSVLPAQVAQPLNMVWPIVLVLISIPMLGHKIGWKSIAAMVLSFAGVVVVSLQGGEGDKHPQNNLGIFLALFTSLIWSIYWILNKKDNKDPVIRLFLNFIFASVFLILGGVFRDHLFSDEPLAWATGAYVGIFEMGVTYVVWLLAMRHAPATDRISNLVFLAPFLNLLIVNRVLDEEIYRTSLYGIFLLIGGILLQNMLNGNAKRE